ncbi:Hsp20 family protein, partial [Xanthomonas citri pv. citri]|nr:Hsp20 family protein [Xanthomonas citri pv. citri]
ELSGHGGRPARQLTLGEGLALDRIQADYSDGVLTLTIPVAEQAKPRKISVTHGGTAPVAGQTVEAVEGSAAEASGE